MSESTETDTGLPLGRSFWAIQKEALASVLAALRGRSVLKEMPQKAAAPPVRAARRRPTTSGGGYVAVIPLTGLITPRGSWLSMLFGGGGGLIDFRDAFREALHSPEIQAIVLDVDSPGGYIDLVPETAQEIYDSRGEKPIVAVANTTAGSAAYWIASQADELVVTPSGSAGSIGVYMLHEDWSKFNEDFGVDPTYIFAGRYKVDGNPDEPLSETALQEWQQEVDDLYALFVDAVARGRGVSAEAVKSGYGEGRILLAARALEAGLVDRIDTLETVVGALLSPSGTASAAASRTGRLALSGKAESEPVVPGEPETAPDPEPETDVSEPIEEQEPAIPDDPEPSDEPDESVDEEEPDSTDDAGGHGRRQRGGPRALHRGADLAPLHPASPSMWGAANKQPTRRKRCVAAPSQTPTKGGDRPMTPTAVKEKDKLAQVEAELAEKRDEKVEAEAELSSAQETFAGSEAPLSRDSDEFKAVKSALGKVGELDDRIHELTEMQVDLLKAAGKRAPGRKAADDLRDPLGDWDAQSLLAGDGVVDMLEQYANSASKVGRNALGEVASRDALAADVTGTTNMRRGDFAGHPAAAPAAAERPGPDPDGDDGQQHLPVRAGGWLVHDRGRDRRGHREARGRGDVHRPGAVARTIAHWLKLQKQSLEDVPALRAVIENRLRYGVQRRLEAQVLNGNGTAPNLRGILQTSGIGAVAFDAAAEQADLVLDGITTVLLADARRPGS
jgi:signal peptide peptidase SppA